MYFWFFKRKKWGKKTAETRRRNCAVFPFVSHAKRPSGFFRRGARLSKKGFALF